MNVRGNNSGNTKFIIRDRLRSFRNAFNGLFLLVKAEHNARIHLFVFIIVVIAAVIFKISLHDWIIIIFAAGLVFISECFNTAIEYLGDSVSTDYNEKIKRAKDVAAAGVLISAIVAILAGIYVFLPVVWHFLTK